LTGIKIVAYRASGNKGKRRMTGVIIKKGAEKVSK